jgi:hypothetical protein
MRADEKLTAFLELESAIWDCSIGSKLSLQRGTKFREEMENGLRLRVHPAPRPPNPKKKRKSNYEKSKHSVQTNSRGSAPAAVRLLCGSVNLGTHSGSSPRYGALQWHCLGVR